MCSAPLSPECADTTSARAASPKTGESTENVSVCKKHFGTSHELHIHTFVSEMATKFQQSAGRTASEETKPREVPCDICTGVKFKALKSCLVCVASYREAQLEQHQMVPSLKRHNLFEPLINLEDRMCKKHDELKELFCKIVQVCVCQVCAESDHESHDIVPLIEECEEKMAELEETDAGFQQMIQDRQLKMQELWDSAQLSHKAADKEIIDGMQVFTVLS